MMSAQGSFEFLKFLKFRNTAAAHHGLMYLTIIVYPYATINF